MSLICAYQNCLSIKYPCGSTAFFRLPSDSRRSVWIKNSGNKSLENIGDKANRFFCENHFRECDIRNQFNRKILRKHAVPIAHPSCKEARNAKYQIYDGNTENHKFKNEEINLIIEKLDDFIYTAEIEETDQSPPVTEYINESEEEQSDEQLKNTYAIQNVYFPIEKTDMSNENYDELTNTSMDESPDVRESDELSNCEEMYEAKKEIQVLSSDPGDPNPDLNQSTEDEHDEDVNVSVQMPTKRRKLVESPPASPTQDNDYQDDKHFALSLVGYFQRLPKSKKALAKLQILQYLTELDVGCESTL